MQEIMRCCITVAHDCMAITGRAAQCDRSCAVSSADAVIALRVHLRLTIVLLASRCTDRDAHVGVLAGEQANDALGCVGRLHEGRRESRQGSFGALDRVAEAARIDRASGREEVGKEGSIVRSYANASCSSPHRTVPSASSPEHTNRSTAATRKLRPAAEAAIVGAGHSTKMFSTRVWAGSTTTANYVE